MKRLNLVALIIGILFVVCSCSVNSNNITSVSLNTKDIFSYARNSTGGGIDSEYRIDATLTRQNQLEPTVKTATSKTVDDIKNQKITFDNLLMNETVSIKLEVYKDNEQCFYSLPVQIEVKDKVNNVRIQLLNSTKNTEPTIPGTEPSEPGEPSNPSTEPTDPIEPVEPDPVTPTDPSEPSEPDPEPVEEQTFNSITLNKTLIPYSEVTARTSITIVISGTNFYRNSFMLGLYDESGIQKDGIIVNTSTFPENTTSITQELEIPKKIGIYTIKITVGGVVKGPIATFEVIDDSLSFGDVVLSDGRKIAYNESYTFTQEEKDKAVAIIFREGTAGTALGLGLQEGFGLEWAKRDSDGCTKDFTEIECTPLKNGLQHIGSGNGWDESVIWSGDVDGSDNWEAICVADSSGSSDPATNYPVFNYALNYGTIANLTGTAYSDSWFVPSIAELAEVYKERATINTLLNKLGVESLQQEYYWTSSQSPEYTTDTIQLSFSNTGTINSSYRQESSIAYTRVIRKF